MKILFLTQIVPYPPANGGAIKTFNILKHLGGKHDVRLLAFTRSEAEERNLLKLTPFCRDIDSCRIRRSPVLNLRDAARTLVSGKSFIIERDFVPEMKSKVADALREGVDLLYIDHLQMFRSVPEAVPCPIVLDEHNVEWRIIERFVKEEGGAHEKGRSAFARAEWPKLRRFELDFARRADLVFTVTEADRETLAVNGIPSEKIFHIPIGVDTDNFVPLPSADGDRKILSIGTMSWPPNIDSALWFYREIYPLIRERVPGVFLSLVGANPPREIKALAETDKSVRVTGFVEDVRTESGNAAAFVVPLRIGSGMRVKIIDAMAMGLPVVTTSVGCEGINLTPGTHALVADTPELFAESVVRLMEDFPARTELGKAGRGFVEENFAWPPILARLDNALERFG